MLSSYTNAIAPNFNLCLKQSFLNLGRIKDNGNIKNAKI